MGLGRVTTHFHSAGIYWALILCQALCQVLRTLQWERPSSYLPGALSAQTRSPPPPKVSMTSLLPPWSPPPRSHLLSPFLGFVNFHRPQSSCLQSMRQNDEHRPEFASAASQEMLITFGLLLGNGLQRDTKLSPGPAPGWGAQAGYLPSLSPSFLVFKTRRVLDIRVSGASCPKSAEPEV